MQPLKIACSIQRMVHKNLYFKYIRPYSLCLTNGSERFSGDGGKVKCEGNHRFGGKNSKEHSAVELASAGGTSMFIEHFSLNNYIAQCILNVFCTQVAYFFSILWFANSLRTITKSRQIQFFPN